MTKEETSKLSELGERMVRMEVLLEALTEDNKQNTGQRKALAAEVAELTAVLNQGKGAKLALIALTGIAGSAGAFITYLITHITK